MKYQGQIRTGDFEYLHFEVEGTAEEAVEKYRELKSAWEGGAGLPEKEFNAALDEYLTTKTLTDGADRYAAMNTQQRGIIQTIKRSFARTNK